MSKKQPYDERTFLHGATQSLFSSLRIEEALHAFIRYLEYYIPLDVITAGVVNDSQNTIRYLAAASTEAGILVDETVRLSSDAVKDGWKYRIGSVVIDNCVSPSRIVQESREHFIAAELDIYQKKHRDRFSTMTITIGLEKPIYAVYNLTAFKEDQYTDLHKDRLKLLEQPLKGAVLNLVHHRDILSQNENLKKTNEALRSRLGHSDIKHIIGAESGLKDAMAKVRQVAITDSPVLLKGETGTGKELFAHVIHQMSNRSEHPIVCINCGAIPESLVDSELFGYEKGAFTGAQERKRGYFEQADKGTIFLDEVAELPLSVQVKLLRVLQEKMFYRVGGQRPISVNIRVIAATHRNLESMVEQGTFREDLWFRLNVFPIHLPPLRERAEDIPELSAHIAALKAQEMNLPIQPRFASEAMQQLKTYAWPGNIRELQNIIERRLIINRTSQLSFPDLAGFQTKAPATEKAHQKTGQFKPIHDLISGHIKEALQICNGKIYGPGGAADLLGINPSTLQGKMRKYRIKKEEN